LALERYEANKAEKFNNIFAISEQDHQWYRSRGVKSEFMPVFHGFENINIEPGRGKYILYQGDLSIESNQRAILDLVKIISPSDQYPVVVAGRSGEPSFEEKLLKYPNIRREADVSEDKMSELIREAQIVIIHSRHSAGMKVKVFPAVYQGKYIIANENSKTHTNLDKALHIYPSVQDLGPLLKKLWASGVQAF
jgi:hypothetical protein